MVLIELQKGNLLYRGVGYEIYATDDDGHAIMEWEDECACRLSHLFHSVLRRHALGTNVVQKRGEHGLIVRRLEPIPVKAVVWATRNETELQLMGSQGSPLSNEDALKVPGVKPTRLDVMGDTALHTARTLRTHLLAEGVEEMELRLTFGVASSGECQMQAINPPECKLGSTDYHGLCERLGGDLK